MRLGKLLRPFRNRLLKEDLLRSFAGALAVSSLCTFAFSSYYHIKIQEPDRKLLLLCFGASFLAVFLFLFFLVFFPWRRRVARRIDDTGLKERVSTMIEYRDDDSEVAAVQRGNALWYLRTMSPRKIRFNISPKRMAAAVICFALMVTMLFIPYDIFARINPEIQARIDMEKKIAAIAERIRHEITAGGYPDAVEASLLLCVDGMQANMLEGTNDLQRATSVLLAKQDMQAVIDAFVSRLEIGDALQKQETTRSFGVSVTVGDTGMISDSLTAIKDRIVSDRETIPALCSDLSLASSPAGVEEGDGLSAALTAASEGLSALSADTPDEQLSETFVSYSEDIISEIERQVAVEASFAALARSLQDIQDDLLGYSRPEDPAAGVTSSDDDVVEVDEGVDLNDRYAFVEGNTARDIFAGMDEPMYDPELGMVTFGEVYEKYYEKYKEQLKSGVIPEELREMLDRYFMWLNS